MIRTLSPWLVFAALLAAPPLLFEGGFPLTLASQAGIAIILALSYNMLFGQTGLLSFGHAVYSGLGAYAAIHALKLIGAGSQAFPVALLPLIGAAAGGAVAVLLGYVSSRRGGLTFAMISLGIGEMVHAAAALFPALFGGESGITADRAGALAVKIVGADAAAAAAAAQLGLDFSSARAVCALIAVWTLASALAMYGFTRTPLGRLANAVRDNPERAAQVGIDPRRVRWLVMIAAGAFAGIAGSLSAILFEIVSAENLGVLASASMLFATFIGGTGTFFGPVAGALVYTLMSGAVASVTPAWPIYVGALFIVVVLKAPGGLLSLPAAMPEDARLSGLYGQSPGTATALAAVAILAILAMLAGFIGLVESAYALAGNPGSAAGWLATLPGGRAAGVIFSGVLFIAGRETWNWLAARRQALPDPAAGPERAP